MKPSDFYDELAPYYHLIFPDWEESVRRQSADLDGVIRAFFGEGVKDILDVSCGVGTQALGLAKMGYRLTCSDISEREIRRAAAEAGKRGLRIDFSVADMREAFSLHNRRFDLVISCDNSVPHLLSDDEIEKAFRQFYECVRPGGGCIISVRDYDEEEKAGIQVKPYGVRVEKGVRYLVFQVWEFKGSIYKLSLYFVEDSGDRECKTHVIRTKYYAVGIEKLISLLEEAGFTDVRRIDGRYFQPLILGRKK